MVLGVIVSPQSPKENQHGGGGPGECSVQPHPRTVPSLRENRRTRSTAFPWDPAGALACGLCQADISLRLTVLKSPLSLVYVVHAGL